MLDYIETAMPGSLLRIADLDSEQLDELLDLAEHIEGEPHKWERKIAAACSRAVSQNPRRAR